MSQQPDFAQLIELFSQAATPFDEAEHQRQLERRMTPPPVSTRPSATGIHFQQPQGISPENEPMGPGQLLPAPGTEITQGEAGLLDRLGLLRNPTTTQPYYPIPWGYQQIQNREGLKSLPGHLYNATFGYLDAFQELVAPAAIDALPEGNILKQVIRAASVINVSMGREPILTPNPESIEIVKEYVTGNSPYNWDEMVNAVADNFQSRSLTDQVLLSLGDPTIAAGKIKLGTAAASFLPFIARKTPAKHFFKDSTLNRLDDFLRAGKQKPKPPVSERINELRIQAEEALTDKFAWTNKATDAARAKYVREFGENLPVGMDAEMHFALMSGRPSAILDEAVETVENATRILDGTPMEHVDRYLILRHTQDQLLMHPGRTIPKPLLGRFSNLYEVTEALTKMQNELGGMADVGDIMGTAARGAGPNEWQKIVGAADQFRGAMNTQFRRLVNAGMIDPKLADELETMYPWYNPTRYVEELGGVVDDIRLPVTHSDNGLRYLSEHGMDMARISPTAVFFNYMARSDYLLSRNEAARAFVRLLKYVPEFGGEITKAARVKPVAKELTEQGRKTIFRPKRTPGANQVSYLADGGKLSIYDISPEAYHSFQMLKGREINLVQKWLRYAQAVPRAALVTYNPPFMAGQFLFDGLTVAMMEGVMPRQVFLALMKNLKAIFKNDPGMREMIRAGGDVSGYWGKGSDEMYKSMVQGGNLPLRSTQDWNNLFNPLKWPETVKRIGHSIEMAPRRAVFEQRLKQGLTKEQAAFHARRSTVDFARSGTALRAANDLYLFLNPAVQGTLLPLRALKRSPKVASIGLGGYMALQTAAYGWNRQFPEYADVKADDRHGKMLIMLPSEEYDDFGNKVPHSVAGIPILREMGAISAPMIYALEKMDASSLGQRLPEWLRSGAQVQDDFGTFMSSWGKMASPFSTILGVGGAIQAPTYFGEQVREIVDNKDNYYQRPIVPDELSGLPLEEQYDEFTSLTSIRVGKWLGLSPMKIDHMVRNGAMFDIILAIDNAIKVTEEGIDPYMDGLLGQLEDINERYAPEDIQRERNAFFNDLTPTVAAELRRLEHAPKERLPVLTTLKNRFWRTRGGALWEAGNKRAEKETGYSAEQTKQVAISISQYYEDIAGPAQYELDQKYFQYQEDPLSEGALSPESWLSADRMTSALTHGFIKGQVVNFPSAAQVQEDPQAWVEWQDIVHTVGGTLPDSRSRGQWLAAAFRAIPLYDELTGLTEAESAGSYLNDPDYRRLFQMQDEFLAEYPADWVQDMRDWQASTRSPVEQKRIEDFKMMRPYWEMMDRAAEEFTEKFGRDKKGKSALDHIKSYHALNPNDKISYSATRTQVVDLGGPVPESVYILEEVQKQASYLREQLRLGNLPGYPATPEIEALLLHWGIVGSPKHPANITTEVERGKKMFMPQQGQ